MPKCRGCRKDVIIRKTKYGTYEFYEFAGKRGEKVFIHTGMTPNTTIMDKETKEIVSGRKVQNRSEWYRDGYLIDEVHYGYPVKPHDCRYVRMRRERVARVASY